MAILVAFFFIGFGVAYLWYISAPRNPFPPHETPREVESTVEVFLAYLFGGGLLLVGSILWRERLAYIMRLVGVMVIFILSLRTISLIMFLMIPALLAMPSLFRLPRKISNKSKRQ